MASNTRELEQIALAERVDLDANVAALHGRLTSMTDWQQHYRAHMGAVLGVAVLTGIAAAIATAPAGRSSTRGVVRGISAASVAASAAMPREAVGVMQSTGNQIAMALVRLASAKVIEVVGRFVPGFEDELAAGPRPDGPGRGR